MDGATVSVAVIANGAEPELPYAYLIYFNEVGTCNHFAAWQEPNLLMTEVRAAFRSLPRSPHTDGGRHE